MSRGFFKYVAVGLVGLTGCGNPNSQAVIHGQAAVPVPGDPGSLQVRPINGAVEGTNTLKVGNAAGTFDAIVVGNIDGPIATVEIGGLPATPAYSAAQTVVGYFFFGSMGLMPLEASIDPKVHHCFEPFQKAVKATTPLSYSADCREVFIGLGFDVDAGQLPPRTAKTEG